MASTSRRSCAARSAGLAAGTCAADPGRLPPLLAAHLASRLGHEDARLQERSAGIAGRLGAAGDVDPEWIVHRLRDRDPSIRARAADVLGRMGAAAAGHAGALVALLADEEEGAFQAAGRALAQLGPEGLQALAVRLEDPQPQIRVRAAAALTWAGEAAAPWVSQLARRIGDDDDGVWDQAAEALVKLRESAARQLTLQLWRGKERQRRRAADTLARMGAVGAAVVSRMASPPANVGPEGLAAAAAVLTQLGDHGAAELGRWLEINDPRLRAQAVDALAAMDGEAAEAARPHMSAAVERLVDPDVEVRRRTFEALADAAARASAPAADSLVASFAHPHAGVVRGAVQALGRAGALAPEPAQAMAALLRDGGGGRVWRDAGEELARGGPAATGALSVRLEELYARDAYERMRIEEVLAWTGAGGAEVLAAKLQSPRAVVRAHAARALGRFRAQAWPHLPAMKSLAEEDPDASVRRACTDALARAGHPTAAPAAAPPAAAEVCPRRS